MGRGVKCLTASEEALLLQLETHTKVDGSKWKSILQSLINEFPDILQKLEGKQKPEDEGKVAIAKLKRRVQDAKRQANKPKTKSKIEVQFEEEKKKKDDELQATKTELHNLKTAQKELQVKLNEAQQRQAHLQARTTELQAAKEQATAEAAKTTNTEEERQAAAAELKAKEEELQATKIEVDTSKKAQEELQGQLSTMQEQHQVQLAQLAHLQAHTKVLEAQAAESAEKLKKKEEDLTAAVAAAAKSKEDAEAAEVKAKAAVADPQEFEALKIRAEELKKSNDELQRAKSKAEADVAASKAALEEQTRIADTAVSDFETAKKNMCQDDPDLQKKVERDDNVQRGVEIERLSSAIAAKYFVDVPTQPTSLSMTLKLIYQHVYWFQCSEKKVEPDWSEFTQDAPRWDKCVDDFCGFRNNLAHYRQRPACTQDDYELYYDYFVKTLRPMGDGIRASNWNDHDRSWTATRKKKICPRK